MVVNIEFWAFKIFLPHLIYFRWICVTCVRPVPPSCTAAKCSSTTCRWGWGP